jgi:hypothetical protein
VLLHKVDTTIRFQSPTVNPIPTSHSRVPSQQERGVKQIFELDIVIAGPEAKRRRKILDKVVEKYPRRDHS